MAEQKTQQGFIFLLILNRKSFPREMDSSTLFSKIQIKEYGVFCEL